MSWLELEPDWPPGDPPLCEPPLEEPLACESLDWLLDDWEPEDWELATCDPVAEVRPRFERLV
jgi:hypothetical protein